MSQKQISVPTKIMEINETRKTRISEIYKEAGLLYIRYEAEIEHKSNGQQKIGGKRTGCPEYSKLEKTN